MNRYKFPVGDLANFLNRNYSRLSLADLQNLRVSHDVIQQAALHLFSCTDYRSRNAVLKVLQRNTGNIGSLLSTRTSNMTKIIKRNLVNNKFGHLKGKIRAALVEMKISIDQLLQSYFSGSSVYARICIYLNMKNSVKNRRKLYSFCKRNFNEISIGVENGEIEPFNCSLSPIAQENSILNHSGPKTDFSSTPIHVSDPSEGGHLEGDIHLISADVGKKIGKDSVSICSQRFGNTNADNCLGIDNKHCGPSSENLRKSDLSSEKEFIPSEINRLGQGKDSIVDNILLPLGTRNIKNKNWRRPCFSKCTIKEGEFVISKDEFCAMSESNKLIRGNYAFVLNKKIKSVNNTCFLYFKTYRFLKRIDAIKLYAYCSQICKCFILLIKDASKFHIEYHAVEVFSSSKHYNHLTNKSSQLRGVERKMVKNKIMHLKPLEQKQNDVLLNQGEFSSNVCNSVKSDNVYRKLRSEIFSKNDRHSDLI